MECPRCRNVIPNQAGFCAYCGFRLAAAPGQVFLPCPTCGQPNDPAAQYCSSCGQPLSRVPAKPVRQPAQRPAPPIPAVIPGSLNLASPGLRALAFVIDSLLVSGAFMILYYSVIPRDTMNATQVINWPLVLAVYALQLFYYVGLWSTTGRTLGKLIAGIKVVDRNGNTPGLGRALLRYLGYFLSSNVLYLGFFAILSDSERQGWHDKIAGTYVVKT